MPKKCVYILHKNGANSHYTALKHLLDDNNIQLKYYEFCVLSKLVKSITKLNFKLFKKQLQNFSFFVQLLFSKNKKVVVGIAPFDYRLLKILPYLKKHQVYYHSSWTSWDGTFYPNQKKVSAKVKATWKFFLENKVKQHFVVTKKAKKELLANYAISSENISVVYHSLKPQFLQSKLTESRKKNSFIYLGRLLPQKGIEEMLRFFEKNKHYTLSIIGQGKLSSKVSRASQKNSNITYKPFIANIEKVINEIGTHEFMLLNSKKTKKWEELFGLVVIEAMSQGTIPVAADHTGPKEIINNSFGYLFNEGNIAECITNVIAAGGYSQKMAQQCVVESQKYAPSVIANNWNKILD